MARIWSFKTPGPEVQQGTGSISGILPENQTLVQVIQTEPQPQQAPPAGQRQSGVLQGAAPKTLVLPTQASNSGDAATQNQTLADGDVQHSGKRKRDSESGSKKRSSCGQDPVKAPSTKPWPVFTIPKAPTDSDG